MQIHVIRHATLLIHAGDRRILVDPMLSPAGAMDPIASTANQLRNPLVELPFDDNTLERLLGEVDAVLVTHRHRDHWDPRAEELLPRDLTVFCQPEDEATFREAGFSCVLPIATEIEWGGLRIIRTAGRHGTGEIGQRMAPVSGFMLRAPEEPCLYLAGDTVWCEEVADALRRYQPDVTVVNAGAARFTTGDPITMTAGDVGNVCRARHGMQVIAVHMNAINHCGLSRAQLRAWLGQEGLLTQVRLPEDGMVLELEAPAAG